MPRGCDTDAADVWDAFWRRRDLLRAVEGGATRTELSEATGVSRSTADRAVRELVDAALLADTGDGYRRTLAAELLLAEYDRVAGVVGTAASAAQVLETFPDGSDPDPAILADAEVVWSVEGDGRPVEQFVAVADSAADLRLYADVVVDDVVDCYRRHIVERGLETSVVVSEDGLERLVSRHSDPMQEFIAVDHLEMRHHPEALPYSLQVADAGDPGRARMSVLVFDSEGESLYVGTDDRRAVAWAADTFDRIWREAGPIPPRAGSQL
jgi:predicted transcriptional regulator